MPDIDAAASVHPATHLRRNAERHQRVRRAGIASASLLAVLLVATLALATQSGDRRTAPPADPPPLTEASLLIEDELQWNNWLPGSVGMGEPDEELSVCQRQTMRRLGASGPMWHSDHRSPDESDPDADYSGLHVRQVTAQWPSPQQAAAAFRTIESWLTDCSDIPESRHVWSPVTSGSGRAQTFGVAVPLATRADKAVFETASIGIHGAAITMLTTQQTGPLERARSITGDWGDDPRLWTMRLALLRLAGTRTTTANAIPDSFRLVEETKFGERNGIFPSGVFDAGWFVPGCRRSFNFRPETTLLQTGMRSIEGGHLPWSLQLAMYPDEETARVAADELVVEIAACAGGRQPSVRMVATPLGQQDVYVQHPVPDGVGTFVDVAVVAVVQLGNAVYLPVSHATGDKHVDELPAQAMVFMTETLNANLESICELADGCP